MEEFKSAIGRAAAELPDAIPEYIERVDGAFTEAEAAIAAEQVKSDPEAVTGLWAGALIIPGMQAAYSPELGMAVRTPRPWVEEDDGKAFEIHIGVTPGDLADAYADTEPADAEDLLDSVYSEETFTVGVSGENSEQLASLGWLLTVHGDRFVSAGDLVERAEEYAQARAQVKEWWLEDVVDHDDLEEYGGAFAGIYDKKEYWLGNDGLSADERRDALMDALGVVLDDKSACGYARREEKEMGTIDKETAKSIATRADEVYGELYDAAPGKFGESLVGSVGAFDAFLHENGELVRAVTAERGDVFSSDREGTAFMVAATEVLGREAVSGYGWEPVTLAEAERAGADLTPRADDAPSPSEKDGRSVTQKIKDFLATVGPEDGTDVVLDGLEQAAFGDSFIPTQDILRMVVEAVENDTRAAVEAQQEDVFCEVTWCRQDIIDGYHDMFDRPLDLDDPAAEDYIQSVMDKVSDTLEDRSIERGWDVINEIGFEESFEEFKGEEPEQPSLGELAAEKAQEAHDHSFEHYEAIEVDSPELRDSDITCRG